MDDRGSIAARYVLLALSFFVVAGLLIVVAGRRRGPTVARRLWMAYLTEFVVVAAVIVPAFLGAWVLFGVMATISVLGTLELHHLLGRAAGQPLTRMGVVGSLAILVGAGLGTETAVLRMLVGATIVTLVAGLLTHTRASPGLHPAALTLIGLIYPSLFGAYLVLLGNAPDGFGAVAFLVGVVELNDCTAMLGGMLIGGPRLWPRLSPNKTVAGSGAGLLAAAGGALALGFAVPSLAWPQVLGAGVLIGIGGQAGDLVASALKRAAGVKDFAGRVPGQGGILDIYDGLLFSAPLFWLYLRALGRT